MYYIQWMVVFSLSIVFVSADRIVKTTTGKVRGITVERTDGNQVEAFLGIPYAEPPVGQLRFEKPLPIRHWEGEYNATFLPPPCFQNYTLKYYGTPDLKRMSEDCLYLNIWVPGTILNDKPKAVFVWIHGGSFNVGSSEMDVYNGALLASRGNIIVISFNYRLGMFGFLTTSIPEVSGNMGLYDQILALKWIRANVEYFGGNPELITAAGQGAGAVSAASFVLSPKTHGIVKRVILQSAGLVHPVVSHLKPIVLRVMDQISRITGCSDDTVTLTTDPKMVVNCLKNLPPHAISDAEGKAITAFPISGFPHLDESFMPRDPTDMLIDGDFQDTEVLLGCDKDEGSNFLVYAVATYRLEANIFTLNKYLPGYAIRYLFANTEQKNITGDIAKFYIEGNGNRKRMRDISNDDNDETDYLKTALYDSIGDYVVLCPTVFQADFLSVREKPVYFYMFTHRPSTSVNAKWMGVTHFDEVPFVFGRPLSSDGNYSEDDKIVSRRMMDRWIAFTKTGNPNIEGETEWPPYKWNDPLYLDINVKEKVKLKPDYYRCEFWRGIYRSNLDHFQPNSHTNNENEGTGKNSSVLLLICSMLLLSART